MNEIINLCKILDSQKLYQLSDTVFNKFASNQSIMDKKIFIPYEIKNVAEEAYKKRLDKINFAFLQILYFFLSSSQQNIHCMINSKFISINIVVRNA
jgi:hypothetical protein